MKKKIIVLGILMIVTMLFTGSAFAAEIFTHEGSTYVIDEVKPKVDSLSEDIEFWGMDRNNNYIYLDYENEKFYKVTEKECTVMSSQEILDLMNYEYYIHNFIDDNNLNIYQEENPKAGYQEWGYIITEDKIVDSNKEYLERTQNQVGENISIGYQTAVNPDLENGTYYERVYLITPKTAEIDENISYYKYDNNSNTFVKVENPKEEEAYIYAIIGNVEEVRPTKIGEITQEVYNKIFPAQYISYYIHFDKESKEIYILINYMENEKSIIYKTDGTVIKEFDELMFMDMIGNKFFIVTKTNEEWELIDNKITIIDKKGNTVYESTNLPYFEELGYVKHTTYLKDYEWNVNKFYNMYDYELLSQDNQKYEGEDLTVKTSGELDRLTSVKVNGIELEASNYTKKSGSTIITLKNDYLKTLTLGTYTLELGYVDGTKIETKFIVDKLYNNEENDGNSNNTTGNAGGVTGEGTSGEAEAIPEPEDKLDDTPKTGNATNNSNLGLYITLIIVVLGAVITRKK